MFKNPQLTYARFVLLDGENVPQDKLRSTLRNASGSRGRPVLPDNVSAMSAHHAMANQAILRGWNIAEATAYDILPASDSGAYFAGGILIGSTLASADAVEVLSATAPACE